METKLAWLAGFMEGEGTFSIYHQKRKGTAGDQLRASVSVTNTDPHLISECNKIFTELGCVLHIHEYTNKKGSTRPVYDMQTSRAEYVKIICEALLPYLIGEKKAKAELLISFVTKRMEKLGEGRNTIKGKYDEDDWDHFHSLRSSETTRETL